MRDKYETYCGKEQPMVIITVDRYREDGGAQHPKKWCLECVQGKNPVEGNFTRIINEAKYLPHTAI